MAEPSDADVKLATALYSESVPSHLSEMLDLPGDECAAFELMNDHQIQTVLEAAAGDKTVFVKPQPPTNTAAGAGPSMFNFDMSELMSQAGTGIMQGVSSSLIMTAIRKWAGDNKMLGTAVSAAWNLGFLYATDQMNPVAIMLCGINLMSNHHQWSAKYVSLLPLIPVLTGHAPISSLSKLIFSKAGNYIGTKVGDCVGAAATYISSCFPWKRTSESAAAPHSEKEASIA